jgi:membrane protein
MLGSLLKQSVVAFIEDDLLSRGASIAFYAVTSMAPVLVMIVAIAGLAFGVDAARGELALRLNSVIGRDNADFVQGVVVQASSRLAGTTASIASLLALLFGASGVFGELQAGLNAIWKVSPGRSAMWRLVRARLISLGLVCLLGCLLLLSIAVNTLITYLGPPQGSNGVAAVILHLVNEAVSLLLLTFVVTAIYKILPDTDIGWRCALTGGTATALLFEIGKFLLGFYLGRFAPSSAYGAAGSLLMVLLWTYYSAQIFLFGAQLAKAYDGRQVERNRPSRP